MINSSLVAITDANPLFAILIINHPHKILPLLDCAIIAAERSISHDNENQSDFEVKLNVHVRFTDVPIIPEVFIPKYPRCKNVGKLICLSGTVIRTGSLKMMETFRIYECCICKKIQRVDSDESTFGSIKKPTPCQGDHGKGKCNSLKFDQIQQEGVQNCIDYQEIKIQEQVAKIGVGTIPKSIMVVLKNDLADKCKAGDNVSITGYVIQRWRAFKADQKCELELALIANFVEVQNETSKEHLSSDFSNEFEIYWQSSNVFKLRNDIVSSFCPQIYGMSLVKLGIILTILGGVGKESGNGTRIRGEGHLLLVGDPGTAKSQFLKHASKLTSRAVMTTGIGTTNAGLTVTAIKEGGDWQLEAGALVLADKGICCIDEFNSIKEGDRTSIHEAMEQQTLSVAKAGLVCKLNTRCSVFAACNSKGKFDESQSLSVNLALASPLLSRFDLVFVVMDLKRPEWDRDVSSYILNSATDSIKSEQSKPFWNFEKLKRYISYVKSEYHPNLTEESSLILTRYYQLQRQADLRNSARTTIRMLESLVRLSQAHAKLMCHRLVEKMDAVMAIIVMESSFQSQSVCGLKLDVFESFPSDPDKEFKEKYELVLQNLGLNSLCSENE